MENKKKIRSAKGSVFDIARAEGIAVFIPTGLTAIRVEAERFRFRSRERMPPRPQVFPAMTFPVACHAV